MKNKKPIFIFSIIILAIAITGFVFLSKSSSKQTNYSSGSSGTTARLPKSTPQKSKINDNTQAVSNPAVNQTNNLPTPTGNFVSNHNPNTNDPRQLNEISVCYTSPGAYCDIQFSLGSSVISLGKQKVGPSGSVSWNWSINKVGLYQGKWTVTAIATLNGISKSAEDQIPLTIQ